MYKLNILIIILLMTSIRISASILEVGLSEDFDYNTIQSAVDAAVDYDTVLVHPGRYIENVEILEKSLTIGSLFLTTGNQDYVDSTIIDGDNEDTVLSAYHNIYLSSFKVINVFGLSITNGNTLKDHHNQNEGRNYIGGGIAFRGCSFENQNFSSIQNCKIFNNTASSGGGIYLYESNIMITGCEIFDNNGSRTGGGIYCLGIDYQLEFSIEHPNSIYNNSAGRGRDICIDTITGG